MNTNTNRKGHLIGRIVTIAVVGIVILAVILCLVSYLEIKKAYHNMAEEELKVACVELQDMLGNLYNGEWHMEDGKLWKGEWDLEGDTEDIEKTMMDLKASTGLDYTIIMDKTRAVTTIDGMKGKDIGDAAYNSVKGNKPFSDFKTTINGKKYYVYYSPEFQDGKFVGCFFAGGVTR